MADVSSLGEYKVVVTADYSQLKSQFEAMANFINNSTKAVTDNLSKTMGSLNATMTGQIKTAVDSLKGSLDGVEPATKKASDGFKSYATQLREAQKEAEKIHQKIEKLKADMASGVNTDVANPATLKALQQEFENARLKVDRLKDAQLDFKNRVDQTALATKEMDKALAQAAKDEQNLMKQNAKLLEGEMRSRQKLSEATKAQAEAVKQVAKEQANVVKQLSSSAGNTGYGDYARRVREEAKAEADFRKQQGQAILAAEERAIAGRTAAHKAAYQEIFKQEDALSRKRQAEQNQQNQRIRQLQTQYKVAYEEVNKYLQSHAKMSEAVFIRLQGRLTAIGNEIRNLGAIPPMGNPLEGLDFDKYVGAFGKLEDAAKSLKHHLTWMASAVAIGGIVGLPVVLSEATKEFEALNTKIMQNLELTEKYRGNHAALTSDVQKLGRVAQDYAKGFGMSVQEVQEAMQIITRRFKDVNTATYLTGVALKMSRLDFVDTGKSARDLESVLLQFGMGAKEAGKFLNDFSVMLHTTRINGTEMLDALERSGSAFRALNMNVSEAMAAIATLATTTGLSGSTIGMSFKSIATNLDTKKGRQALESLGIALYKLDADGKKVVRNGKDIILELQDAFKNLNEEGQRNLAYLIAGGKYQANAAMALLRDTGGVFRKALQDMKELSSDAMTDSLLEKSLQTYAVGIERFKASATILAQTVGGTLLPVMEGIVYAGIAIADVLTQNADTIGGTIEALGQLAMAFVAVRLAMLGWGIITFIAEGITTAFTVLKGAITGVSIAQIGLTVITTAQSIASGIATAASVAYGIAMGVLTGNLTLAGLASVACTAATLALETALLPLIATVAAVAAAIALLIAALYEVVTNWDEYSGLIQETWNTLVAAIATAVEIIIDVLSPLIIAFYGLFEAVRTVFVKLIIPAVQWAAEKFGQILDWVKEKLGIHGKGVQGILAWIANRFDEAVKWIRDNVSRTFADFLDGTIGQLIRAAQKISNIASQIQKAIKNAFTIGGDTSINVEGGSVGTGAAGYGGGGGSFGESTVASWGDFKKAEGQVKKKGFIETFLDEGLAGLAKLGQEQAGDLLKNVMGDAYGGMMGDKDNPYALSPELLRGYDDLEGGGGGAGSKGKGSKGAKGAKEADNSPEAMGYRYLVGKGLDKNMVLGLLGNIMQESGFNPDADNGSHRGLIQWDYNDANRTGRWYDFMDDYLANLRGISEEQYNAMDIQQKRALQYDFAIYEMRQGNEQEAYRRILSAAPTTPEQWASLINQHYERSGEAPGSPVDWQRQRNAREYATRFERKNGEDNYTDGEKAIKASYQEAKKLFDLELERLKTERQREGQKVSAREELQLYEKMMGIGNGRNPFAVLENAQKDYAKKLTEYAKEEAKRAEYAQKATDTQVAAIDKMADSEVAFAEKLGLMSKADVRDYYNRKNERNYAMQKPILDAKLASTVALDRGTAEDMMAAYQGLIYAKDRAEAEWYAKKLMWLSRDVDATKKALDEEMKLEEAYRQKQQDLAAEAYQYNARYTIQFIDSFTNGFQSGLESILNGTKSFGAALRDMFKGIVNDIIKLFTQDLAEKVKGWLSEMLHPTGKKKSLGQNRGAMGAIKDTGIMGGGDFGSLILGSYGDLGLFGRTQGIGLGDKKGKGKGGSSGLFGGFSVLDNLIPKNTMQEVKQRMNQIGSTMQNTISTSWTAVNAATQQGTATMQATTSASTAAMGAEWGAYKTAQVTTEETGDTAIVAQSQTTAATVQATTTAMMGWIMAVLALFSLFGGFGGGGSSETKKTSSVNLGRSPDSYYMTPTPVMQSTTFNVPSFDIGGNIERDMFAMVHKNEMVLTPEQADVIRNTARNGGSLGGGNSSNANIKSNIQVSTVDSRGFERVLRNYNRDLSKNVKKGIRNGYLTARGLV
jgi:TP901 family phage tail tape measure protein